MCLCLQSLSQCFPLKRLSSRLFRFSYLSHIPVWLLAFLDLIPSDHAWPHYKMFCKDHTQFGQEAVVYAMFGGKVSNTMPLSLARFKASIEICVLLLSKTVRTLFSLLGFTCSICHSLIISISSSLFSYQRFKCT